MNLNFDIFFFFLFFIAKSCENNWLDSQNWLNAIIKQH